MRVGRILVFGGCVAAVMVAAGCGSSEGPSPGGAVAAQRNVATTQGSPETAAAGSAGSPTEAAVSSGTKWSAVADPNPDGAPRPPTPPQTMSISYGDVLVAPGGKGRLAVAEEGGGTWETFDVVTGAKVAGITSKVPFANLRALSHDGLTLAVDSVLDRASVAQIWSIRDNAKVREIDVAPGESLVSLDFMPNGQLVSLNDAPYGPRVAVWDVGSGRMVREFTIPDPRINGHIHSRLAISPGGRYIAVLFRPATLHVYDVQRGVSAGRIDVDIAGAPVFRPQSYVRFKPDGRQLALCLSWVNEEDRFYCWDLATGRKELERKLTQLELQGFTNKAAPQVLESPFDWLPDGSAWLVRGRYLVDSGTGDRLGGFANADAVTYMPLTRQSLLAVKRPGFRQSQRVTVLSEMVAGEPGGPAGAQVASKSQLPAATLGGTVIGGVVPQVSATPTPAPQVAATPNPERRVIVLPSDDDSTKSPRPQPFDVAKAAKAAQAAQEAQRATPRIELPIPSVPTPVPPAPDAAATAGAEGTAWRVEVDPSAEAIDVFSAAKIRVNVPSPLKVLFPNTASNFAVMCSDGEVLSTVDLRTGSVVGTVEGRWLARKSLAVSPDGQQVSYFYPHLKPDSIQVWSLAQNKAIAKLPLPDSVRPQRLAYAGNRWLVGIQTDETRHSFVCWDVETEQIVATASLAGMTGFQPLQPVAISPGGRYLAALNATGLHLLELPHFRLAGHASIHLWNESGQQIRPHHESVGFSPDGTRIAAIYSSYERDTVLVWETATGMELLNRHFQWMIERRVGARLNPSQPIAWFPDNSCFLYQGQLVVDALTGAPVWKLPTHSTDDCLPLASQRLAMAGSGEGRSIEIRDVAFPKLFGEALQVARRTPSERMPKLTEGNWTGARQIDPRPEAAPWGVTPDPIAAAPERFAETFPLGKAEEMSVPSLLIAPPAAATMALQRAANPMTMSPTDGPMRPERMNSFEIWNLRNGQRSKTQQLPGNSTLIDISPDGSLVLTGDTRWVSYEPHFLGTSRFDRIDVWAPQLDRHAVGWRPAKPGTQDALDAAHWANFVDKLHVLVGTGREVTLWKLPECQAEYVLRDAGELGALSPNRKYLLMNHSKRGLELYETLTGERVGQLTWPYRMPDSTLACARFHPQGQRLVALLGTTFSGHLVEWDMKTGELVRQFGVPLNYSGKHQITLEWHGDQHVLTCGGAMRGKTHLIDLQRRAVVAEVRYERGTYGRGQHDDTFWFENRVVNGANEMHLTVSRKKLVDLLDESKLPTFESVAMLYPGMSMKLSNKLHLSGMDETLAAVRATVAKNHMTLDDSSPYRLELESRVTPAPAATPGARIQVVKPPNFELFVQAAFYDEAGNLRFRQRRTIQRFRPPGESDADWDRRIRFDMHEYFSRLEFPLYVYREEALKSLATLEL